MKHKSFDCLEMEHKKFSNKKEEDDEQVLWKIIEFCFESKRMEQIGF